MKKLFFMLSAVIALSTSISSCGNSSENKTEKADGKETYSCPMHPEVTSDKPGTCPKCGMDLEKAENK